VVILKYYYIYNLKQSLFLIKNGVIPIEISVGKKGDVYHKFAQNNDFIKLNNQWAKNKK